ARVALADLDRDGALDLVLTFADGTDRVEVRRGNGDGTFAAPTTAPIGADTDPTALALGDLDGDGVLDAVVTEVAAGAVRMLFGGGGGLTLGSQTAVGGVPADVALGDVNRDG